MFEINPVLSGKFSAPDYAPAPNNFNKPAPETVADTSDINSASSTNEVDPRRHTRFDRTASQVGDADMSFSDFLDAVNPLQHIPVISSAYRAVAGEDIHPVARVTGDILYGGVFGIASAVLGIVGGIGDSVMIAKNGQSMAGTAMVSLLGNSKEQETQLASAEQAPAQGLALANTPAPAVQQAALQQTLPTAQPDAAHDVMGLLHTAKAFPLKQNKAPFGGVMDLSMNAMATDMLARKNEVGPHGKAVYESSSAKPVTSQPITTPVISTDAQASKNPDAIKTVAQNSLQTSSSATQASPSNPSAAIMNEMPKNLIQDLISLREFKSYPTTAEAPRGANVNITN